MDTNQETKVIDLGGKSVKENLDSTKVLESLRDAETGEESLSSDLEQKLRATSKKLSENDDASTGDAAAEKAAEAIREAEAARKAEDAKKAKPVSRAEPVRKAEPAEKLPPQRPEEPQKPQNSPMSSKKEQQERTEQPDGDAKKISVDQLSDEEFLRLYGDGERRSPKRKKQKKGRKKQESVSEEEQSEVPEKQKRHPVAWFKNKLTDENIDDETAKNMVNVIGIVGGITFILAVVLVAVILHAKFSSFSSQFNQAVEFENAGDVARAAGCYEKAIDAAGSKGDRIRGRMALANLYLEQRSDNNASFYFEQVVDIDPENEEAITKLLSIYESNNNMEAIVALAEKASDREETQALFADYLLNQPVFNYKSGTYDERLTIEIEAGEAERIYYTTDGSEATEMSRLYTGPIQLEEGHTVFHAMAVSGTGLMSQNIEVNYEIMASAPEKPRITPSSGTYREITKIHVDIPDGCRAYYTLDGNVPTAESPEYTEDLVIPLGNHIFSVIFINQNGLASQVSTKVYDFIFSAPITKNDAINKVTEGLIRTGELLDDSGEAVDPAYGTAQFQCSEILTINDAQFYRVDKIYSGDGAFGSYAVEINTGAVFALLDNNGNYTLVGF